MVFSLHETSGQHPINRIAEGQEVVVDAFAGEVILSPDAATRLRYEESIRTAREETLESRQQALRPVRTSNGSEIAVMANVGCAEDVAVAAENGADGVGLYRMDRRMTDGAFPSRIPVRVLEISMHSVRSRETPHGTPTHLS